MLDRRAANDHALDGEPQILETASDRRDDNLQPIDFLRKKYGKRFGGALLLEVGFEAAGLEVGGQLADQIFQDLLDNVLASPARSIRRIFRLNVPGKRDPMS